MTGLFTQVTGGANPQFEPEWVDEVLLAGAADDVCLDLGAPVSRGELGRLVAERHRALADAGLRRGGSVALCLPPSLAFITNLLASWQIGPVRRAPARRDARSRHHLPGAGRGTAPRAARLAVPRRAGSEPLVGRLAAYQGRGHRRSADRARAGPRPPGLPGLSRRPELPAVERQITTRLAPYKRPRRLHVVEQLPRTATGKLVRSQAALRDVTPGRPGQPHPSASAEPLP